MKNYIIIILLLILNLSFLFILGNGFQAETQELRHTVRSLEESNTALKNAVVQQQRKIEAFEKILQKSTGNGTGSVYWICAVLSIACLNIVLFLLILKKRISPPFEKGDGETSPPFAKGGSQHSSPPFEKGAGGISDLKDDSGRNPPRPPFAKGGSSQHSSPPFEKGAGGISHELPLKLGLEIHRMRKRIEHMPARTPGLGALKNALKRLEESFNEQGYELIDWLGKPFSEGLTLHARFVPSEELTPGEQIITKVIRPQINFNGVLVQAAEVEVGVGAEN
jgi:hypothetical protein